MSTPTRSDEAVQRIVTAAAEIFAEEGFAGARMDEIARRAGVNKAMLYYHIGDKSALYDRILLSTIKRIKSHLVQAVEEEETPEGKLRAFIGAISKISIETPHLPPLIMREVATGGANVSEPVIQAMAEIFGVIRAIVGEGEREGRFRAVNPLLTHMQIMGSILFLTKARPIGEKIGKLTGIEIPNDKASTVEEISRHVTQMILYGMRAGKAGPDEGGAA